MAKGDHQRVQNAVDYSTAHSQQPLSETRQRINEQGGPMWDNYMQGTQTDLADYNSIMNNYNQFFGGGNMYGAGQALGGYGNFAQTGGFTPQNIQDIRARMIAPIRGVYSRAQDEVNRQRRLQHGYSPNATAAQAKMAREQAYSTSDATTNAEAAIAQMIQQGKLAGLGGLSQTSLGLRGQDLGALGGMTGLYNATPGLSQTFGQQVATNRAQDLQGQELQQQLDEMRIRGILGEAQVPGNWQSAMGNIGSTLGLISQAAGAFSGLGGFTNPFGGHAPVGYQYDFMGPIPSYGVRDMSGNGE